MAKAGAAIASHVAAHDTFAQARLEWLIDHAAVFEILRTATEKIIKRQFLGRVLGCVQYLYHGGDRQPLDLPDALAAVAPVALDHARTGGEPCRQLGAHRRSVLI